MDTYRFFFDDTNTVLLAKFGTALDEQSVLGVCEGTEWFVRTHGTCRGIIDLRDVVCVTVSTHLLIEKSRINRLQGQPRVLVAPTDVVYGFMRLYQIYQGIETGDDPMIARSIEETYSLLGIDQPNFIELETPRV